MSNVPAKQGPGRTAAQVLTPPPLLDRLAALVPPPRVHRHRYFGVLAPNSPRRAAVTALAPGATTAPPAPSAERAAEPAQRRAARYAWALLLARIYEMLPLVCPLCGAEMRIIAFITDPSTIHDLLLHVGPPTAPPRIAPAGARRGGTGPMPGRMRSTLTPSRHPRSSSINASRGNPDRRALTRPISQPVCRFYIPPAYGNSHFLSASRGECAEVRERFPMFVLESDAAFYATVPDLATGACPPTSYNRNDDYAYLWIPVFRLWNQRADTNHRYTSDRSIRSAMIDQGWVPEGHWPDGVAFCMPLISPL